MSYPTYEILNTAGDVYTVHMVSSGGYDEMQTFKAAQSLISGVLNDATVHFENQHGWRQQRSQVLHTNTNPTSLVSVEHTYTPQEEPILEPS
jgi:hypothetical protein